MLFGEAPLPSPHATPAWEAIEEEQQQQGCAASCTVVARHRLLRLQVGSGVLWPAAMPAILFGEAPFRLHRPLLLGRIEAEKQQQGGASSSTAGALPQIDAAAAGGQWGGVSTVSSCHIVWGGSAALSTPVAWFPRQLSHRVVTM